ncbi:hypothetical protein BGZ54_004017 [Gamsiella multidivaricata]|nr:hypothetical protein BGZ54_004017 [Gamsiella multidivaricata]
MDPWDTPAASTMPVSKWDTNDAQASSSASHGSATASDADHDQWEQMKRQMEAASISNDRPHSGRPSVTLKDVWPTFMEADQARDLDDVKAALAGLCEASKGGSWKDLEHRLRDENCNTYLEDNVSFGYTLVNLKSEPNQQYRVIPSFIKPGTVKRGRMSIGMAASYEENFARLDNAGVVRPSGVPNCHNCKQDGHIASECREEKRESERSEYFGKCYNCGSEDHRTRNCNEPRKVRTCRNCGHEGHMARECTEPEAPIVCNRCNQEGHMARDCAEPRTDMICRNCQQVGHVARDCLEPRTDVVCRNCQQMGHMARDCREPRMDIVCIRCNQPGHMVRDCLEPRTDVICIRCDQPGHIARECLEARTDITCNRCSQPGHMARDCLEPRTDMVCRNCQQVGHVSRDCREPRQLSSIKCYNCDEFGHRASDCPNEPVEGASERRRPPPRSRFGFSEGF